MEFRCVCRRLQPILDTYSGCLSTNLYWKLICIFRCSHLQSYFASSGLQKPGIADCQHLCMTYRHSRQYATFAQYPVSWNSGVSVWDSNLFWIPTIVVSLQICIENWFVFSDVATYCLISPLADIKNQRSQIVNISAWLSDLPNNMLSDLSVI